MSAPQGPRTSRGRARGRARNGGRLRDIGGDDRTKGVSQSARGARLVTSTRPSTSTLDRPPKQMARGNERSWSNSQRTSTAYRPSIQNLDSVRYTPKSNGDGYAWRDPKTESSAMYQKYMSDLYQQLKKNREKERTEAIRNGFLSDPDKPTSLADAITPVGTCPDMCPEFERVERIVQLMVDGSEKSRAQSSDAKVPSEQMMVKRFRRSAAGYDEQLPSDIRPPLVLRKTLSYLFNEVIGHAQSLATVHKFVWDRTRGIRNDFSIQQVTKVEDLRIAIDCFERIARFHILSLHQLSRPGQDNGEFDHHQEREQLNNTLLSLMYYYDDSRQKLKSPNEAEFRAYCIIFETQDQRPDLEDRAQNWPRPLLKDRRVQTALKLYAAAGNISDEQGPLRPRASFSIAQGYYGCFWSLVGSNAVSYLMACAAEIYFNHVRRMALDAIWKAYKRGGLSKVEDWVLGDLANALGFDDEAQVQTYCEEHGFTIGEQEDGEAYLDVASVSGRWLADSNPRRKQIFSKNLVEQKRLDRTLPAIINGLSVSQARAQGLLIDSSIEADSSEPIGIEDSLFLSDGEEEQSKASKKIFTREKQETTPQPPHLVFSTNERPNLSQAAPIASTPTVISTTAGLSSFGQSSGPTNSLRSFGQPSSSIFGLPTPHSVNPPTTTVSQPGSNSSTTSSSLKFDFRKSFLPSSSDINNNNNNNNTTAPFQDSKSILSPHQTISSGSIGTFEQLPNNATTDLGMRRTLLFNSDTSAQTLVENANQAKVISAGDMSSRLPASPFQFAPQNSKAKDVNTSQPVSTLAHTSNIPSPFQPSTTNTTLFPTATENPQLTTVSMAKPSTNSSPTPGFAKHSASQQVLPTSSSRIEPQVESQNWFPMSQKDSSAPTVDRSLTAQSQNTSFSSQDLHISPTSDPFKTASRKAVSTHQAKIGPPKPDPRPKALEKLSNSVMLQEDGLLQQFLDFTMGPIISQAMIQVQDENSWEEAAEIRHIILGKKYLRRWQERAWRLGLLRKGRERRKNFASSMRTLALDSRRGSSASIETSDNLEPHFSIATQSLPSHALMDTPVKPFPKRHRNKSLPHATEKQDSFISNAKLDGKLKHDNLTVISDPKSSRSKKLHHIRSSTLENPRASTRSRAREGSSLAPFSKYSSSLISDGSLLSESVMKQARRLVPAGRMDTTQTDYFRLKSLGIDPDTPLAPFTRKRRISDDVETDVKKASRLSPTDSFHTSQTPRAPNISRQSSNNSSRITSTSIRKLDNPDNHEDDDLFSQMHQVRDAMSDSISWFRSEREKSEVGRSSTHSHEHPERDETEKERQIRRFTCTPSRTEIRRRQMASRGLLPKDLWKTGTLRNGERVLSDEGERQQQQSQGFGAMSNGPGVAGVGGFGTPAPNRSADFGRAPGSSADDAIEL